MSRKVEIDVLELLDVYIGGLSGDLCNYLFTFLRDDCGITFDDVKQLACKYATMDGYDEKDVQDVLLKGEEFKKVK